MTTVEPTSGTPAMSTSTAATRRRRALACVLAPTIVALVVFLWDSGTPALWSDEGATARDAWRDPGWLLHYLSGRDAVLGAYYLFMHVWMWIADSEFWMRLPSVLAMTAAVGLTADIARRWWGPRSALVTGAVLALAPTVSRYAAEARPYAIAMGLAAAASWFLIRALPDDTDDGEDDRRGRRRKLVGYAVSIALLGLTHLLSLLVLVPHLVYVAAPLLTADRRRAAWASLRRWAIATGAGLLPCLALALIAYRQREQIAWLAAPGLADVADAYVRLVGTLPLLALFLALAVTGARVERAWLTAAVWFGATPLLLAAAGLVTPLFHPRYALVAMLGLALLVGAALRRGNGHVLVMLAVLAAVLTGPRQLEIRAPDGHGPDVRPLAATLREQCRPGDAAKYTIATVTTVDYYLKRGDGAACRPVPYLWGSQLPTDTQRVWVFHEPWDDQPASPGTPGFTKVRDVPVPVFELSLWERR